MRIVSRSGSVAELAIVGYEQPPSDEPTDGGDWLIVRGQFSDSRGSWRFQNACLDTDDAAVISTWLSEVASGSIEPSEEPGRGCHAIAFTEPDLQLRFPARVDDDFVIRILLMGPAAPLWATTHERGSDGYPVELAVTDAELRSAVSTWRSEVQDYPCR